MLDPSFAATPVADANGHAYPPLSLTLAEPACEEVLDNTTLADGVFDCASEPRAYPDAGLEPRCPAPAVRLGPRCVRAHLCAAARALSPLSSP